MQETKYFYDGIPLGGYCKIHDINVNTIRTRIWKKKQDEKYKHLSDADIIDMVIKAYGTNVVYTYKKMSLRQYCQKNKLNYHTILSRIKRLKETDPGLTEEDVLTYAIEDYKNGNYRFFYDGKTLIEYCMEHPEIKYGTIRSFINQEKKRNPELDDKDIIQMYIDKEHKGIHKYYYDGMPLIQYCEENNLNYRNLINYISRYKNFKDLYDLSDDEFIDYIMLIYEPFEPKYMYQGITLSQYCQENDLSYYSVVSFVKRKLEKDPNLNIDELIDEGIKTINRYGIIYYYKGIPLIEYAKNNGLNASSIRTAILRKLAKSEQPLQEIVDECVELYNQFNIKYYYNNETLHNFCKRNGLSYSTLIYRYLDNYHKKTTLSIEEAIKEIVEEYLQNPPQLKRFFYGKQSLASFCNKNNYSYSAIYSRIRRLQTKNTFTNDDDLIKAAIEKYEYKLEINKINEIFTTLKSTSDIDKLKEICNFLKIDFSNVEDLVEMNFSYNQAINIIWYFSDKQNNDGNKIITDTQIQVLFKMINDIMESNDTNGQKYELVELIGLYKTQLYDSRNCIILRQKKYMYHLIHTLCREYNIKTDPNNLNDFVSELTVTLISIINRSNLNNNGQVVNFIDISLKGYFRKYLIQYLKFNNELHLDQAGDSDKSKNKTTYHEYIANPNDDFNVNDNNDFTKEMSEALSNLSPEDLTFIILKFQECYNTKELADHFKMTIDEIEEKERCILMSLKENPTIKKMILK